MGDISRYFDRAEFACKCGCGFDTIAPDLVAKLDHIRAMVGQPLTVHSGCRCNEYNQQVGGEANSAHTRGMAADIGVPGSAFRFIFVRLAVTLFQRIGVYKTFCHVDVDETLPRPVMWFGQ